MKKLKAFVKDSSIITSWYQMDLVSLRHQLSQQDLAPDYLLVLQ